MEDLGNINITIRESVGGRGASGGVGGGPGGMARSTPEKEVAETIKESQEAQEKTIRELMEAVKPRTGEEIFGQFDPFKNIIQGQEVSSELLSFLRRPSFGSATGLLREGAATRTMLNGLGTAGQLVGVALLGVGAIAGTVALAMKGFEMASQHASERIEATWRYSAQTASAMAEQQIAQIAAVIEEVQMNSDRYAAAIRAETFMMVEQARFNAELAKTTSVLARTFNQLRGSAYYLGRRLLEEGFIEKALPGGTGIVSGLRALELSEAVQKTTGMGMWEQFNVAITRMVGGDEAAKKLTESYMAEIARNTRKDTFGVANEWFQADIKHLTGREF